MELQKMKNSPICEKQYKQRVPIMRYFLEDVDVSG